MSYFPFTLQILQNHILKAIGRPHREETHFRSVPTIQAKGNGSSAVTDAHRPRTPSIILRPRRSLCSRQGKKKPRSISASRLSVKRRLPTLPLVRSTIGVAKLNFSVRNGKRWNLRAIVTLISLCCHDSQASNLSTTAKRIYHPSWIIVSSIRPARIRKAFGQLVMLGFAVSSFTPASYQRCRLQRP